MPEWTRAEWLPVTEEKRWPADVVNVSLDHGIL